MGLPLDDNAQYLRFGRALAQPGNRLNRGKRGMLAVIDECAGRAQGLRFIGADRGVNVRTEQELREAECQHSRPGSGATAQEAPAENGWCAC